MATARKREDIDAALGILRRRGWELLGIAGTALESAEASGKAMGCVLQLENFVATQKRSVRDSPRQTLALPNQMVLRGSSRSFRPQEMKSLARCANA